MNVKNTVEWALGGIDLYPTKETKLEALRNLRGGVAAVTSGQERINLLAEIDCAADRVEPQKTDLELPIIGNLLGRYRIF